MGIKEFREMIEAAGYSSSIEDVLSQLPPDLAAEWKVMREQVVKAYSLATRLSLLGCDKESDEAFELANQLGDIYVESMTMFLGARCMGELSEADLVLVTDFIFTGGSEKAKKEEERICARYNELKEVAVNVGMAIAMGKGK